MTPRAPASPEDPLRRWSEFLASHRLRATGPRRLIFDAIARSKGHFDAEMLRLRLRGMGQRLSRATIYRTLALLQGGGILRRVQIVDGALHYELARPDDPHHHLICRRCGTVREILDTDLTAAVVDAVRKAAFTPEEISLRIRGLCDRCQQRKGPERPPGAMG